MCEEVNGDLEKILCFFPDALAYEIAKEREQIEEIRLRLYGKSQTVLGEGRFRLLSYSLSRDEMAKIASAFCRGSYHSQAQNIKEGFISYPGGWRIGVCGKIGGRDDNDIFDITSLCIRVPRRKAGCADAFVSYLASYNFTKSVLVFSSPGVGKTTLLRECACLCASSPHFRRIALIDSRGEFDTAEAPTLDIYKTCNKASAIEMATRTMSPQMIILDEIGASEAETILSVASCGVPIIASAHADSMRELLSSPPFAKLYRAGIFDIYVRLGRKNGKFTFDYSKAT